jgi:hypothetical protein
VKLSRSDPTHAATIRRIKLAAEEAKIELSRVEETSMAVAGLTVGGAASTSIWRSTGHAREAVQRRRSSARWSCAGACWRPTGCPTAG